MGSYPGRTVLAARLSVCLSVCTIEQQQRDINREKYRYKMDLLLYGAVPFNLPEDSIVARRRRKTGIGPQNQAGDPQLSLDQTMMLAVATEAAEAIQFILGPRHRSRHTSASPQYRNPELKSYRCPPNTPARKISAFDFDISGIEADRSESESSTDDDNKSRMEETKKSSVTRKRRRLVSFSEAAPTSRRVPHKKPAEKKSVRKINSRQKNSSSNPSSDLTDGATISKLSFFSAVQKVVNESDEEIPEKKWKNLGKSLRAIADRFGGDSHGKQTQRCKNITMDTPWDALPNGMWSAVLTYVFWKLVRGWK